jgi:hypothetical protein
MDRIFMRKEICAFSFLCAVSAKAVSQKRILVHASVEALELDLEQFLTVHTALGEQLFTLHVRFTQQ